MTYKTLKKSDVDFNKYLMGTFSADQMALPVQNVNVGTHDEIITFEIVDKKSISRPHFLIYWATLIKLHSYLLIILPMFFVGFKNYLDDRFFDPFSFAAASLSMLFLFAGLNLRSDLNDHISGFDRVIEPRSPKPILLGWITAHNVRWISWVFILIAAVISVPVFILQSEEIRVFAVIFILFVAGQFFKFNSYKNQRFGEIILFILMGPGLCSAYQVALGAGIDTEILGFGVFWGFAVLFLVYLNNFSNLLASTQAGIQNTMNKIGFDASKRFLILCLMILNVLWILYHYFYASTFWTWFGGITLVFWSVPTAIQFSEIVSPVGSDLFEAQKTGKKNFLLMIVLLFLEQIWYLGNKINWTL
jgi:1,4-dihydroxy-2-naphthoate octaprenyltransferase